MRGFFDRDEVWCLKRREDEKMSKVCFFLSFPFGRGGGVGIKLGR